MRFLFKNGDPRLQGLAFKSDREVNLRFRELRDEAVAGRIKVGFRADLTGFAVALVAILRRMPGGLAGPRPVGRGASAGAPAGVDLAAGGRG